MEPARAAKYGGALWIITWMVQIFWLFGPLVPYTVNTALNAR